MVEPFFKKSRMLSMQSTIPRRPLCGNCGLDKTCISPKMPPSGKGRQKILIVAEAPGADEDDNGIQLVGQAGQHLIKLLKKADVNMRKDCRLTNAIICRPPKNRTPTEKEISYCRPNLVRTVEEFQPEIIIPLGGVAIRSLIQEYLWRDDIKSVLRWVGWKIPSQKLNAWICPTYHPSALLRQKDPFLDRMVTRHLTEAAQLDGRPWSTRPNFNDEIRIVLDHTKAARRIDQFVEWGGATAFDFETNMLKPEHKEARIYTCSICWKGKETIAFPFFGEVISAMKRYLRSDCPKIASNLKFEDRWAKTILGVRVRNWKWDTMLGAHWLDHRTGITSIKFQAFVLLGFDTYNGRVEPFLSAKHSYEKNRIDEIDLQDLLLYNGLDSLLEYKVAKIQRKALKEYGNG